MQSFSSRSRSVKAPCDACRSAGPLRPGGPAGVGSPGFLLAAALCLVAWSARPCQATEEPLPDGDTKVDEMQERVSAGVSDAAAWLDSFFADENYEDEVNSTRLDLGVSSFSEKGQGTDFKGKTRLRLKLPGLENRLKLSISGATDDFDLSRSEWEDIEDDVSGTDGDHLRAWLTYFFRQDERRNVSLSGGVKFDSGNPGVFVQPRYRHTRRFPTWDLRFIQWLTWYSNTGLDSRTELQLERPLGTDWFFRTTARVDWYEEEEGLFPQLRLSWRRPLSQRRVVALQWNSYFETRPTAVLDSMVLRLRYRQQTWRQWLWFSVAPQVAFPRSEDYDAIPGLFLEVEAQFQRKRRSP